MPSDRVRPRQLVVALVVLLVVALLVVLLRLLLAAPGGVIADAGRRTVEQGTARVAVTTVADSGIGGTTQRIDTVGLVDFTEESAQFEVRVGVPQRTGVPTSVGGPTLLVTTLGPETYVRYTAWSPSRPWALLGEAEGEQVGLVDLEAQLDAMARGVTTVEEVGTEAVRGRSTTHYRADVTAATAASWLPAEQGETMRDLAERGSGGTFPLDVWVADGLVRRLSYTVTPRPGPAADEASGLGAGASVTVVSEYYDFGVPFELAAPLDVDELTEPSASAEPSPAPTDG